MPTRRELADISMLADGTLAPEREGSVRAAIEASPELQVLYERERAVADRLRETRQTVRAPHALRELVERQRRQPAAPPRRQLLLGGGLAGALAAVALVVVLALPGGTPGGPSISLAAALATRGAASPAPLPDPSNPAVKLSRDIEEVYFPNWSGSFGWRATGERADTIDGRRALTVYYAWRGKRVAYTIVAAPALRQTGGTVTMVNGSTLRTLKLDGRLVVTWRRAGHTCVLSASNVGASALQRLAAWKAPGLERR